MSAPFPPDHPTGFSVDGWRLWLVGEVTATFSSGARAWRFVSLEESAAAADHACTSRQHFLMVVHVGRVRTVEAWAEEDDRWWSSVTFPRKLTA